METKSAWILFQWLFGFGTTRGQKVLDRFEHPQNLFSMSKAELVRQLHPTPAEEKRIREMTPDKAEKILNFCEDYGCSAVTPDDDAYPERLRHIYAPPSVLYVLGSLDGLDDILAIAMVGTRNNSEYGRRAAELIAGELASQGVTIISGMAYGIDTISHHAALKAGGRTISVWGTGIDKPYPSANRELAQTIVRNGGAVVTEFPPGTEPLPYHFPIRNRIISGLCQGTVIVEGTHHSGSLITAGHAMTQDRDVFAVPGGIFAPTSEGPNWLISQGAIMARTSEDILFEYRYFLKKRPVRVRKTSQPFDNDPGNGYTEREKEKKPEPGKDKAGKELIECLTDRQRQVYDSLEKAPLSSDQIMEKCGLPIGAVLAVLTQLEIFGLIFVHPGRLFSR